MLHEVDDNDIFDWNFKIINFIYLYFLLLFIIDKS
jgi:hypothetical protein